MKRTLFLTIAILILVSSAARAQTTSVPPLINYQGMLTDANGTGLTGVKKLEFSLYDSATGGNKVWGPQIFTNVPLVNGMFNVILGTTDTEGRSVADAFASGERYLGIKLGDGQEITPRQQILSAPYAIRSEYAMNGVPVGTILSYGGISVPTGFLECDGSEVSRTIYSALFAAVGTSWGSGDGHSTFNVPDLRGRFLRGVDNAVGNDPDSSERTALHEGGSTGDYVGSYQEDEFETHTHESEGTHQVQIGASGFWVLSHQNYNSSQNMKKSGGNETRPKNAYVKYIIKY